MATELLTVGEGILVKAEHLQLGGSHKARPAKAAILAAEAAGHLIPGQRDVILEKSGGNFGMGLAVHGIPRGYEVQLLVRPAFSPMRRKLLTTLGAKLIGIPEMQAGQSNAEILKGCIALAEDQGRRIFFSDQFSNPACIEGHRVGARELVEQLSARGVTRHSEITFVAGVGTGASLVAYAQVLKTAFPLLKVVCAEPLGCSVRDNRFMDHPFQGLDVGVVPALLDPSLVDEWKTATIDEAEMAKEGLMSEAGLYLGPSSCLVYAVAKKLRDAGDRLVVMIGYDGGDTYFADAQTADTQSDAQQAKQVLKAIEWARAALPSSETMGLSITDYEAIFAKAQSYIDEDLLAYLGRDPAARDAAVVEESYLCFKAVAVYRIASALYRYQDGECTFLPKGRAPPTKAVARRLSEMIRSETSVEIHPGAQIGRRFVVDHGTITVIGEQVIIGDDCYILNDVTLGSAGTADNPREGRRHPTLGNRVQVSGHSRVLGPVTIGDDVYIGAHQQIVRDVPSNTRITLHQELLMERDTGSRSPRPEIHATIATTAGSLRVIGLNLDIATVTFVTPSGDEHPQLRILDHSGSACEIVVKLEIDPEADLESVGLRVSAPGISLILQNSRALTRALEAIRGGNIVL